MILLACRAQPMLTHTASDQTNPRPAIRPGPVSAVDSRSCTDDFADSAQTNPAAAHPAPIAERTLQTPPPRIRTNEMPPEHERTHELHRKNFQTNPGATMRHVPREPIAARHERMLAQRRLAEQTRQSPPRPRAGRALLAGTSNPNPHPNRRPSLRSGSRLTPAPPPPPRRMPEDGYRPVNAAPGPGTLRSSAVGHDGAACS